MKKYVKLPEYYLWTLTDYPVTAESMTISDTNCTFYLEKVKYTEEVYNNIVEQSKSYKIVEKAVLERSDDTENYYDERTPESDCLIVKDDCFVGIFTLCTYKLESFMHSSSYQEYYGILFANGDAVGVNHDEQERCPGCWRYIKKYSLEKCRIKGL